MDELRWTELANLVVAWHNRHPLARRIGIPHVHSLGYVMLPFVDADAPAASPAASPAAPGAEPLPPEAMTGSLRERAMARAQLMAQGAGDAPLATRTPARVRPAFDEDFLPPHAVKAVRRWAEQHAVAQTTPRGDVPVRKVRAEAGVGSTDVLARWALTAQVEVGRSRTRLLLGAGNQPAVLGGRLISPVRVLGVAVLAVGLLAGAAWLLKRPAAAPAPALAASAPAARPASAPASAPVSTPASAPASAPALVPVSAASSPSASAPASAPEPAAVSRPIDVEPRLGQVELPSITPHVDERRRRAREAAAAAASAAASAAPAHAAAHPAAPPQAAAPPARLPAAAPSGAPTFAVTTRLLRTRSESEQVAAAMRELLTKQAGAPVKVDVLPVGDDWRVVGFPYADKALAEKAQALLASRGMKVQVIDF